MGKGKVSEDERQLRLSETAKLLVRRRSYVDVERELVAKFGINSRTARKWIKTVKDEWRAQADVEGTEDARADLTAQLDAVLSAAWSNTVIVRDKDGNPVLDQNPQSPGYGKPLVKSEPKVQHILHAVSQLRALKGADKPVTQSIKLDADINAMPDVAVLPEQVQDALRKELEKLAPGGNIRALAGEWFSQTEPVDK